MSNPDKNSSHEPLVAEITELRLRLAEAEETLHAIQTGAVDALVIHESQGHRIYTLESADRPYRLLVEQMQQGAITLDREGSILYANARFAEMLDKPQRELVGMALAETITPGDRFRFETLLRAAQSGASQGEMYLQRADGSLLPALITINVLPADSGAALGGLITDLTAQKHQERLTSAFQALQTSEARFRSLVETSAQIVWTADAGGMIVEDSPSWRAFTGQTYEQLASKGWLDALHTEDRDRIAALWLDAVRGKIPVDTEYRIRHISGEWRWTSCRAVPVLSPDGSARGWVGMNSDITERIHIQEEREKLLVLERTAREDAEAANRMKDEFLATVSHELRTPLSAVLGWANMLRTRHISGEKIEAALETIERNARAQKQLIEDLLDVSGIITGKVRLDVRPIDPTMPIEAALDALQPAAEAKGVRVQRVMDTGIGAISGDPDRLQQVIWNLLSNAIKFTPRGGRVQVRLERVDSHVEVVVSDTGSGIKPEFLPFVFDRFRQADATRTRAHGGLGLGLAIVRHIVELHGGEVRVDSQGEGKGATFMVSLPLIPVYERQSSEERVHPRAGESLTEIECPDRLDGLRVLAVDDEADTCDLLKAMLERCGAAVTTATSAKLAFDAVQRDRFDLIISDIGMPGVDGYELIQMIRNLPPDIGGRTPAIALTAYARTEDRLRAFRAGYEMHVPKPIEYAELVTVMASLAGRRIS
jgi:PAS domain S-box-containing protein